MTSTAQNQPARHPARDLALIAVFAGIIAALGLLPPLTPFGAAVPITAQTLGVMLAGGILGARRGALSVMLLLALVAIGLPLLAGGRGGLGVFFGPSVGYLVGWVLGAFVVGWLTERGGAPYRLSWGLVANLVGGVLVVYAVGIPAVALIADVPITVATAQSALYVPGDLVKVVIAALVARGVHQAYPGLIRARRARSKETAAV
ncbi:MAG TPA: biotin transporter BioY [Nocardioidaceae bacterium]